MTQPLNEINQDLVGCVMLALSTFRRSEQAIDVALSRSREEKKLMVVYVVDINTARYLIGIEEEFIIGLKDTCEAEILEKFEKEAGECVASIVDNAEKWGIQVKTVIQVGRFAFICLDIAKQVKPSLIVTTRSKRPEWVKKFFGAPVDELIANAGCPVLAV